MYIIDKERKMSLKDIVEVSHRYGSDPEYVLAGGGNTSYKTDPVL